MKRHQLLAVLALTAIGFSARSAAGQAPCAITVAVADSARDEVSGVLQSGSQLVKELRQEQHLPQTGPITPVSIVRGSVCLRAPRDVIRSRRRARRIIRRAARRTAVLRARAGPAEGHRHHRGQHVPRRPSTWRTSAVAGITIGLPRAAYLANSVLNSSRRFACRGSRE